MKFAQFLTEELENSDGYMKAITKEQTIDLLKKYCSDSLDNPLWRGQKSKRGEYLLAEGSKGSRKSRHTSNYYTMIIDHLLKERGSSYPLRGASLICTTNKSKAGRYGNATYAVFPYNDTVIGVCEDEDIWDTTFHIGGSIWSISSINDQYSDWELNEANFNTFINELVHYYILYVKETAENKQADKENKDYEFSHDYKYAEEIFEFFTEDNYWEAPENETDEDDVRNALQSVIELIYDPENGLNMTFGEFNELELSGNHEVWMSGKCIMIHEAYYKEIIKELK